MGNRHDGISLRAAVILAKALGVEVTIARRTGEYVFDPGPGCRRVRANMRRKDTPRVVAKLLRDVEERGGAR